MKVVIAIDSFKGSMSSMEAGGAAKEGVLRANPKAKTIVCPIADGGEGTTQALVEGLQGKYVNICVTGVKGKPTEARYGILSDGVTCVMEMAEAAGIIKVKRGELNPWETTTYGVGEMIRDAINKGCRSFIIGIGGSATTEGGIGMLQALGYSFFDKDGNKLPGYFESLGKIYQIDEKDVIPELKECSFKIACDVTNPLCGKNGAVYIYGPQKGVKAEELEPMDEMMRNYARVTQEYFNEDKSEVPGTGAAGGLGFAFLSYLRNVELRSGIDIVLDAVGLDKKFEGADIVVTGEGRMDAQTAMGKVPVGVARLAKKYGCTVVAFAGSVTDDAVACNHEGIDAFFPIVRGVCTLDEAMDPGTAKKNMSLAVEQTFRLL